MIQEMCVSFSNGLAFGLGATFGVLGLFAASEFVKGFISGKSREKEALEWMEKTLGCRHVLNDAVLRIAAHMENDKEEPC